MRHVLFFLFFDATHFLDAGGNEKQVSNLEQPNLGCPVYTGSLVGCIHCNAILHFDVLGTPGTLTHACCLFPFSIFQPRFATSGALQLQQGATRPATQ